MPDSAADVGVLGPVQVKVGGEEIALGTPQQRVVLALLIINRNRPVATETLINAIWERQPPESARSTVHHYISGLRRLLSSAGLDGRTAVARVAPGYRLSVPDDRCDVGRFLAASRSGLGAAASGQFEQASHSLSAALGEWRGRVLEDLEEYGFADEFARAQAEHRLTSQAALAEAEIACGRASSIISWLEELTVEHPYREPLWAHLMTAYYVSDRQADALDAYHRLKTALADGLGVDPAPTVRGLYNRILHQLPLDVQKSAQANAEETVLTLNDDPETAGSALAALYDTIGRRYRLLSRATRIGRSPDNDIVLSDATVSRHHAAIVGDAGTFVITDLGSANGVFKGGQRIRGSAVLDHGDRIALGDFELSFVSDGPAGRR